MEANAISAHNIHFTKSESRMLLALTSVYVLRMLGLFSLLPVFVVYAKGLHHASPTLIGIALGIYGFTQAIFQLPLGFYSDTYGRRPILLVGLFLFALGSFIGAMTDNIYGLMLARALQGSGAIGSVIMAALTDHVAENKRVRAMAFLGISIGVSFVLAMLLGPLCNTWIGVPGIFWVITLLSALAMIVVFYIVKDNKQKRSHYISFKSMIALFSHKKLAQLNSGIFVIHAILTALFLMIPFQLEYFGIVKQQVFKFYFIIILLSFLLSYGFIFYGEKHRKTSTVFNSAVCSMVIAILFLGFSLENFALFSISLFVFFIVFNVLEALLPSLVVKAVPSDTKGSALGMYSTAQFLGVFIGGSVGGWLHEQYGMMAVLFFCGIISLIWAIIVLQNVAKSIVSKSGN